MRPRHSALAVVALVAAVAPLLVAPQASARVPAYHPSRLSHLGNAQQVIVVTTPSWRSSYATFRTYRKAADGRWHAIFSPVRARIGSNGFVRARYRRQSTGTTPAGTFTLTRAFGRYGDPGTAMSYRRFDSNDWWPYDPRDARTYNVLQSRRVAAAQWRKSWAENLWSYGGQYRYGVVINYNIPSGLYRSNGQWFARERANTSKGGGIFLHVNGPGATEGCVSVRYRHMRGVLRWLSPAKHPRIVMGPMSAITSM